MPAFVGTREAVPFANSETHRVLRVTDDYFLVVGNSVPDGRWLESVLPAGEWWTEWAESVDPLVVHVTRDH